MQIGYAISTHRGRVDFMGKYFGTDGFRGRVNQGLTAQHAFRIGRFLGWYYGRDGRKARIVVGKDTRRSSYLLEYALSAGITASGADVYLLHVTTTPSVSYVTRTDGFDCGVMISASHNVFYDNGIKLLNRDGEKMEEITVRLIEDYLDGKLEVHGESGTDLPLAKDERIGSVIDHSAGRNRYTGYLISLAIHSFRGMKIALDCANGSAWNIAPNVFKTLGADVYTLNNHPDGLNINRDAGSTHIEGLRRFVREHGMDVGFAYDGDGDRCLAVDECGETVDGDKILYLYSKYMKERGKLVTNTVVTTIMSNFGLYKALDEAGISYAKTNVGDKYVYEYMVQHGNRIGGEQSGHIIFAKYARTGDGILTSLKVMEAMLAQGLPLSSLVAPVTVYPQSLINVEVQDKRAVHEASAVRNVIRAVENELGDSGRILVRESGTEPLIRVMVEASEQSRSDQLAEQVAGVIRQQDGKANLVHRAE